MRITKLTVFVAIVAFVMSCTSDVIMTFDENLQNLIRRSSKTGELDYYILPDETDYSALPNQDPANPITKEKVELGRMLFFETGLGQHPLKDNCYETYSCSSCHIPSKGFLPGRVQGIADGAFGYGEGGETRLVQQGYAHHELDAQGTRPMTTMNVAYVTNTLWSGLFGAGNINEGTEGNWTGLADVNHTGYIGLEAQNIEGFDLHRLAINDRVLDDFGYRAYFDSAFADRPEEERYTPETASFAMGAFLRTLLTNRAPFQDYLKGNINALTESQKKGATLFFGKAGCTKCHNSPSFSAMTFHALGTADMYEHGGLNTGPDDVRNLGRGMFTGRKSDMHRFKVPQLYNLKDYEFFFHGSSKASLRSVIEFKMKAESENPAVSNDELSGFFKSFDLNYSEMSYLEDFLTNALYDAEIERHVPDAVLSGYCFPNNDPVSREDLGCN
jgi:cytochrome c peroxidase